MTEDTDRSVIHEKMVKAAFLVGLEAARDQVPPLTESERLSRANKMAIFLSALGPEIAAPVIKKLMPSEVQRLSGLMAANKSVSRELLVTILQEIYDVTQHLTEISFDPKKFVEKLIAPSSEETNKPASMVNRIRSQLLQHIHFSELLCGVSAEDLHDHLRGEHPQLIAVVLAIISPATGAKLLEKYSREQAADIAQRLATLGPINASMIDHLNKWVAEVVRAVFMQDTWNSRASVTIAEDEPNLMVDSVADLLSAGSPELEKETQLAIQKINPTFAEKLKEKIFTFDDIINIRDMEIQKIIEAVPVESLTVALKKTTENIRNKFFANMTVRKRAQVEFQIENLPQLTVDEILNRQREIVAVAKDLQQRKEITLERSAIDGAN